MQHITMARAEPFGRFFCMVFVNMCGYELNLPQNQTGGKNYFEWKTSETAKLASYRINRLNQSHEDTARFGSQPVGLISVNTVYDF